MGSVNSTNFEQTAASGQMVLHDFEAIIGYETAVLKKPEHETFCVKYVEFVGDSAKAWQSVFDSTCSRLQAQKNAHRLLKSEEIRRRIAEISAVMRNRDINRVLDFNRRAMNFTPADLFDENGQMIQLKDLPAGTGIEAKLVDGMLKYIPIFPSPEKARDSIAKIMGIEKSLLELTGKDGKPIQTESVVKIYIPDNGRD